MIDIGLSKMALIGAVALIVIGPEKLPRVARTVGTLLGKAQRYVADVKSEVNRESRHGFGCAARLQAPWQKLAPQERRYPPVVQSPQWCAHQSVVRCGAGSALPPKKVPLMLRPRALHGRP